MNALAEDLLLLTKTPMTALERRVVASLSLLYSVRMLGLFMALPLLALYAVDMRGASALMIGIALGAYGATQALLQVPLGWLSDRIGRKPVILGGLVVFALGSVVAALADSVPLVAVGRALQGAGAISSSVMALAADLTSEEQRTKAMAIIGISIGASFALALIFGPLLAAVGGLPLVFWITAAMAALCVLVVVFAVPKAPSRQHVDVGLSGALIAPVLKDPRLRRLDASVFLLHMILTASFLLVPAAIEGPLAVPREQHWKVYLPVLIASLAAMYPLLRLSERSGRPQLALVLAVLLMPLTLAGLFLGSDRWLIFAALCFFFAAVNYLEAVLPSLVSKAVFAHGKGTALGIYATCQFLGAFVGGGLGGFLLQENGVNGLLVLVVGAAVLWLMLLPGLAEPRLEAQRAL
ncbi:MAG: MFS transporter [Pseudomonadota bacterium]